MEIIIFCLIIFFLINRKKYKIELPNRFNNINCYECRCLLNKDNFSGWEVFRKISGKEYSVKICDNCLKKQDNYFEKEKI